MNKLMSSGCGIRFPSMHLPSCSSSSITSPPVKPRNNHHYTYHQLQRQQSSLCSPILLPHPPSSFHSPPHSLLPMLAGLSGTHSPSAKNYDYTLKFLLVGDSDVGKDEILNGLDDDQSFDLEPHFGGSCEVAYKSTVILLDGRRIRLQLWDTSGQGRFSTIIRSYSRGAQGIILVYDITNKWSFSGLSRWLREVEQHAPGVPKILLGNRLHLAFKRQVNAYTAEHYSQKHNLSFFEVSPLCNYNIRESFAELSRIVLQRHGMDNLWRHNTVLSLQELCCRTIVARTSAYEIEQLPLPNSLKYCLKSYSSLKPYQLKNRSFLSHHQKHSQTKHLKELNGSFKKKAKSLFSSMFRLGA